MKTSQWKVLSYVAALATGAILFLQPIRSAEAASPTSAALNQLQDVQGKPAITYLKAGKPTLVKFWASWCPQCLSELGHTEAWAKDARFQKANLVTLTSPGHFGEKKQGDFQKWYRGLNYPALPVLTDEGGGIAKSLKVTGYPSWAVLDQKGEVVRVVKGSINEAQALALIDNPQADLGR
ncbi:MAG: redoxin domain-containing protein [Brachymonas sp.]|nr:redoxin domain-containing protein [Brachymonas sp.]